MTQTNKIQTEEEFRAMVDNPPRIEVNPDMVKGVDPLDLQPGGIWVMDEPEPYRLNLDDVYEIELTREVKIEQLARIYVHADSPEEADALAESKIDELREKALKWENALDPKVFTAPFVDTNAGPLAETALGKRLAADQRAVDAAYKVLGGVSYSYRGPDVMVDDTHAEEEGGSFKLFTFYIDADFEATYAIEKAWLAKGFEDGWARQPGRKVSVSFISTKLDRRLLE